MNKMLATFGILDPVLTVYDTDYTDLDRNMNTDRVEITASLPCQVDEPTWFRATFKYHGVEQDGEMTLILHYEDLEFLGLIDSNGKSTINIGTRLVTIATSAGVTVNNFPNPPGMYVVQARDSSFGLAIDQNPTRNLLFLLLSPRPQGV